VGEALAMLDLRNDLRSGGALTAYARFELVVARRDWHSPTTARSSATAVHERLLRERGIERVTIAGPATDYGVQTTALDAVSQAVELTVDRAGVRKVEHRPGDSERALDVLRAAGATVD
jgi:nicotinamidase-related amidase